MKFQNIIVVCALFWGIGAHAAPTIQSISIGVNGLTCSQCTRSVEMSVRNLDFVDSVVMDLEKTEGIIYPKPGTSVDLRKVAKAVTNAGFSVRFLRIQVDFREAVAADCFSIGPDSFQFIEDGKRPSGKMAELVLIGNEFMTKKELATFKNQMVEKCPSKNGYYVSSL